MQAEVLPEITYYIGADIAGLAPGANSAQDTALARIAAQLAAAHNLIAHTYDPMAPAPFDFWWQTHRARGFPILWETAAGTLPDLGALRRSLDAAIRAVYPGTGPSQLAVRERAPYATYSWTPDQAVRFLDGSTARRPAARTPWYEFEARLSPIPLPFDARGAESLAAVFARQGCPLIGIGCDPEARECYCRSDWLCRWDEPAIAQALHMAIDQLWDRSEAYWSIELEASALTAYSPPSPTDAQR